MLNVYLSGEIHSNWREEIIQLCVKANLDIKFTSPVTDHEASDNCGVDILGNEEKNYWKDNKGAKIKAYDPQGMQNAKLILPQLDYCSSIKEACKKVDAIIIATEWNDFRALDFKELKKQMNKAIIFDLRNIYNKEELLKLDFEYYGIGK